VSFSLACHSRLWIFFSSSEFSVNFSVLVIACWQAFEARNIQSEFAETKYIGLAVFFLSQAFLTGIPVVAITRDIPEAFYLVLSFLVFMVCMAVLSLVFLPKIIMQRAYAKLSLAEQRKKMTVSIRLSAGSYPKSGHFGNTSAERSGSPGLFMNEEGSDAKQVMEEADSSNKDEGSKVESSANHSAAVSETEQSQNISGALVERTEPGAISKVSSYLDDELDNGGSGSDD
jgi:hypothetical protein